MAKPSRVKQLRIWLIGLGMVGRWLLESLEADQEALARRHGFRATVVAAANARDGFIHAADGLDLSTLQRLLADGRPISEHPGADHWPTALDGLRATEADLLIEVSSSASDGEPGTAHMHEALRRGIPVATSNKWPVALHGAEMAALARDYGASPSRVHRDVGDPGAEHPDRGSGGGPANRAEGDPQRNRQLHADAHDGRAFL